MVGISYLNTLAEEMVWSGRNGVVDKNTPLYQAK
jgi:hypothetical protein